MKALTKTDFHFEGQKSVYHGKVRDVYDINDDVIVMVATDRISAFDVILPKGIPFKGQVLNQIAAKFLDATTDICPNWKLATPDPMVTVGLKCEGFRVEMIIRSILTGSAWRAYKEGCRELCGVKLPEGMKENQRFPGEREIGARRVGEFVMAELRRLDHVGYVRFASVYRSFEDVADFREELDRLERDLPGEGQLSLLDGQDNDKGKKR